MFVKSWQHRFSDKIYPAYVGLVLNDILHCFYMFLLFVTHVGIICMLCSLLFTSKLMCWVYPVVYVLVLFSDV